jgi:hypothetical protein
VLEGTGEPEEQAVFVSQTETAAGLEVPELQDQVL